MSIRPIRPPTAFVVTLVVVTTLAGYGAVHLFKAHTAIAIIATLIVGLLVGPRVAARFRPQPWSPPPPAEPAAPSVPEKHGP